MRIEGKSSRILFLSGDPSEAGACYGRLFREEIRLFVREYIERSQERFEVPLNFLLEESAKTEAFIPPAYIEEMRSLAASAGVDYEKILALNAIADIDSCYMQSILHCTNCVISSVSENGVLLLHGRNIDFPVSEDLNRRAALIVVRSAYGDARHSTAHFTWAGMIGGYTGCNSAGVSMSEVISPVRNCTPEGLPLGLLFRSTLENSASANDAMDIIQSAPRIGGNNFAISDKTGALPIAVETTQTLCAKRESSGGRLIVDNCCLCPTVAQGRLTYASGVFRYSRISSLLDSMDGVPDADDLLRILRDDFDIAHGARGKRTYNTICNYHTVHSVLFIPHKNEVRVSQFSVPAPLDDYDVLCMESLWEFAERGTASAANRCYRSRAQATASREVIGGR